MLRPTHFPIINTSPNANNVIHASTQDEYVTDAAEKSDVQSIITYPSLNEEPSNLEVLIEIEVPTILILLLFFALNDLFLIRASHNASFLIITNSFLKEIRLPC